MLQLKNSRVVAAPCASGEKVQGVAEEMNRVKSSPVYPLVKDKQFRRAVGIETVDEEELAKLN